MLFESKYWWKEVGIIIFLVFGLMFVITFTEGIIVGFYEVFYGFDANDIKSREDIAFYTLISALILGFLFVWRLHKRTIKKKDMSYKLFQSNKWWKEYLIVCGIAILSLFFIFSFSLTELYYEPDYESSLILFDPMYFILLYLIPILFVFSVTFLITWLLHRRAINNKQKRIDDYNNK